MDEINGAELLLYGQADDGIALDDGEQQVSHAGLRERVARTAAALRAHGLAAGGRVAVVLPDGIDWAVAWLATVWAGGVAVGVDPRIGADAWRALAAEARFDLVVAHDPAREERSADARCAAPFASDARCARAAAVALTTPDCAAAPFATDTPIVTGTRFAADRLDVFSLRRAAAVAPPIEPLRRPAEAPAFWVLSSGTSGRPKGVVHAQRALAAIGSVSAERLGIGRGDRLYASSKLFFTYPLVNALLAGLQLGATVLLDPQWPSAAALARSVATRRPSVLFAVPSLYRALLGEGLAPAIGAAGVRLCVSAGEALPPRLRTAWRAASGLPMIDGYGTSETLTLVLTASDGDDGLRPSPGVDARPLDPDAAQAGAPTRLLLSAATRALGYHERLAAAADAFRDGAFCPADVFVRTPGAGWRFAGREDSLVKLRGRWVDLAELEDRLADGVPQLREAALACADDADGLPALALFYAADAADSVRARLAGRIAELPPYQRPASLHRVEALPRTATGKLLRRQLLLQQAV